VIWSPPTPIAAIALSTLMFLGCADEAAGPTSNSLLKSVRPASVSEIDAMVDCLSSLEGCWANEEDGDTGTCADIRSCIPERPDATLDARLAFCDALAEVCPTDLLASTTCQALRERCEEPVGPSLPDGVPSAVRCDDLQATCDALSLNEAACTELAERCEDHNAETGATRPEAGLTCVDAYDRCIEAGHPEALCLESAQDCPIDAI